MIDSINVTLDSLGLGCCPGNIELSGIESVTVYCTCCRLCHLGGNNSCCCFYTIFGFCVVLTDSCCNTVPCAVFILGPLVCGIVPIMIDSRDLACICSCTAYITSVTLSCLGTGNGTCSRLSHNIICETMCAENSYIISSNVSCLVGCNYCVFLACRCTCKYAVSFNGNVFACSYGYTCKVFIGIGIL